MASFYADRMNENYKVANSHFVDLGSRLRYYSKRSYAWMLAGAVEEWKGRRQISKRGKIYIFVKRYLLR